MGPAETKFWELLLVFIVPTVMMFIVFLPYVKRVRQLEALNPVEFDEILGWVEQQEKMAILEEGLTKDQRLLDVLLGQRQAFAKMRLYFRGEE